MLPEPGRNLRAFHTALQKGAAAWPEPAWALGCPRAQSLVFIRPGGRRLASLETFGKEEGSHPPPGRLTPILPLFILLHPFRCNPAIFRSRSFLLHVLYCIVKRMKAEGATFVGWHSGSSQSSPNRVSRLFHSHLPLGRGRPLSFLWPPLLPPALGTSFPRCLLSSYCSNSSSCTTVSTSPVCKGSVSGALTYTLIGEVVVNSLDS